ncbi:crossover junction endodeoxyribonuclease RuvC [Pelosinus propionicus]|uniref:Crossover junction endodeoxyribonuclease RuvC n=1 Tax=Pelosinus propionicus DSM 13327 TaxID=1123291 RepID=A0A1I4KU29_9FIRM|nr:crossover junction endodeoxyribonuclease RuvC [Pelosinus propionicus]SFL82121.1 Holliday junction endonuclease RuvC [Pelosinus propionicus DSM 13327]
MLALGIDPGTAICGYGIVNLEGSTLRAIDYGAIQTSPQMNTEERLVIIHHEIDVLIKKYKPDVVGVEMLFFNKNVRTAITVSQARGVLLLAVAQNSTKLAEFTPLQVKQAVVGYGKATKEQVIYMTQRLLNLPAKPHPDDVADALAIAICTTHCSNMRSELVCNNSLDSNKAQSRASLKKRLGIKCNSENKVWGNKI